MSRQRASSSAPGQARFSGVLLACALGSLAACGQPPEAPKKTPEDGGPPPPEFGLCGPAEEQRALWVAEPGLCVVRFAAGVPDPHGLAFSPDGDLFVVSRGAGIHVFWDADGDRFSGRDERTVFAEWPATHGIAFHDGYLYASSETHVVRWPWSAGTRSTTRPPATVVSGIPPAAPGGEPARPIAFDAQGRLLVAAGAFLDADDPGTGAPHTRQSLVKRFELSALPGSGWHWNTGGQVVGSGIRQATALASDTFGRLWAADLGRQSMVIGGRNVADENPADELNLLPATPGFYGHPYCWTEWRTTDPVGVSRQNRDPDVGGSAWNNLRCSDPREVRPPALALPPRSTPMGMVALAGEHFPEELRGDLILAARGVDRPLAVGRALLRVRIDEEGVVSKAEPFVATAGDDGAPALGQGDLRPTGITLGPDGALYVSDAGTGTVFRVARHPEDDGDAASEEE